MDSRREDLTYRRINRLAATQLAGACILVLTIAIVGILQNTQLRRESNRIEDRLSSANDRLGTLEAQVAALQQAEVTRHASEEAVPAGAPSSEQATPERLPRAAHSRPAAVTAPAAGETANLTTDDSAVRKVHALHSAMNTPAWDTREAGDALRALELAAAAGQSVDAAAAAAAELALTTGDEDAALHWAQVALKSGDSPGDAEFVIANVYSRRGLFTDALPHAVRSAETRDSPARTPDRLWLLARIAMEAGETAHAEAALERLLGWSTIGENPTLLSAASVAAGKLALKRGDTRKARRMLDLGSATDGSNSGVVRLSAEVHFAEGAWAEAADKAAAVLADNPADAAMLAVLGPSLVRSGRPEEALPPLRAWIAVEPALAAPHDWSGMALLAALRPSEAVAAFDHALRLEPSPALYYRRGVALLNQGELDGAVASLMTSLEADNTQALPHFAMAICLAKKGDAGSAERALQRALALDASLMDEAARVEAFATFLTGDDSSSEPRGGGGAAPPAEREPSA